MVSGPTRRLAPESAAEPAADRELEHSRGTGRAVWRARADDEVRDHGRADAPPSPAWCWGTAELRSALTDTAITPPRPAGRAPTISCSEGSRPTRRVVVVRGRRQRSRSGGGRDRSHWVADWTWPRRLPPEATRASRGRRRSSRLAAAQSVAGYADGRLRRRAVDRTTSRRSRTQLFRFARTVEATAPLRSVLTDPDLPSSVRRRWWATCSRRRSAPATAPPGRRTSSGPVDLGHRRYARLAGRPDRGRPGLAGRPGQGRPATSTRPSERGSGRGPGPDGRRAGRARR